MSSCFGDARCACFSVWRAGCECARHGSPCASRTHYRCAFAQSSLSHTIERRLVRRRELRRGLGAPSAGRVRRCRAGVWSRPRWPADGCRCVPVSRDGLSGAGTAPRSDRPFACRRCRAAPGRRGASPVRHLAAGNGRDVSRDELVTRSAPAAADLACGRSGAARAGQRLCGLGTANSDCARPIPSARRSTSLASLYT